MEIKYPGETQAGKEDVKCWMLGGDQCGQGERRQILLGLEGHWKDCGWREEGAWEGSDQKDTVQLRLSQEPSGYFLSTSAPSPPALSHTPSISDWPFLLEVSSAKLLNM